MNMVRYIIATVVAWLIFVLGGALWHEVIFAEWYAMWVRDVARIEMPVGYFLITHAMRAMIFVYVYHMLYKEGAPVIKGLKYGFLIGMLTGLTVTGYYGDFNINSPYWAVMEFTYNIIRALVIGVVTALIIGERQRGPVA